MKNVTESATLPAMASIEVVLDVILQIINIVEALVNLIQNIAATFTGGGNS